METNKNLIKAIIAVMKSVKGIDKSMTVGKGDSAYKGISDKDVKKKIGKAMEDNGLCIVPIGVEAKTQIDRWEETNQYGNNPPQTKAKQSVLTEVVTKYLLMHESGESMELAGYGHGTDSQDKAAGKATTYALKYTLLYTFMVATGKIEDTDMEHSDEKEVPKAKPTPAPLKELLPDTEEWTKAIAFLQTPTGSIERLKSRCKITPTNTKRLIEDAQEVMA